MTDKHFYKVEPALQVSQKNKISKMEEVWIEYFSQPKEKRNGIKWENQVLKPSEFDDKYIKNNINLIC